MRVPSDIQTYQARARHYTGVFGPWLEHLVEDNGISLVDAKAALEGWEAIPYVDPKHGHMATLIKKNKEVHFAGYRRFRGRSHINRRRLAEFLQPILDKEHFLVTKLFKGEGSAFILHLGFEPLGVTLDGNFETFILNEIRYPGAKTCKQ